MRQNPHQYAKELSKSLGNEGAFYVAKRAFENTREYTNIPDLSIESNDLRNKTRIVREQRKTSNFWDNVFGILSQKLFPGVARKALLAGK